MDELRVIIAGGRDFDDYDLLKKYVIKIITKKTLTPYSTKIISGCARGADKLGEKFAKEMSLDIISFPADWEKFGKSAGYRRNVEMAKFASEKGKGILIAFWDGKSKGTNHMINIANQHNLEIYVVSYGD